jgi:Tfp pilus assembly protein PilV
MHRKLTYIPTKIDKCNTNKHWTRTTNSSRAGMTLTEVVIASAILIVAMVPILKGLTSAYLSTTIIERKTQSLILSQARLDEIKARSIYHYSQSYAENNVSLGGSYLCNIADESAGGNLRKITVSVGFDLNGNNVLESDEIEVTLATYIAKRWDS